MATGLVWDERLAWHDAGPASTNPWVEPYPALDRPEAKRRLWSLLQASGLAERLVPIRARPATEDELLRFHTAAYIDRVRNMALSGGGDAGDVRAPPAMDCFGSSTGVRRGGARRMPPAPCR